MVCVNTLPLERDDDPYQPWRTAGSAIPLLWLIIEKENNNPIYSNHSGILVKLRL
jgi:hypothetical protein